MSEHSGYDHFVDFVRAIPRDMEPGNKYTWTCPVCCGSATGSKSTYNGHLYANCADCKMVVRA